MIPFDPADGTEDPVERMKRLHDQLYPGCDCGSFGQAGHSSPPTEAVEED